MIDHETSFCKIFTSSLTAMAEDGWDLRYISEEPKWVWWFVGLFNGFPSEFLKNFHLNEMNACDFFTCEHRRSHLHTFIVCFLCVEGDRLSQEVVDLVNLPSDSQQISQSRQVRQTASARQRHYEDSAVEACFFWRKIGGIRKKAGKQQNIKIIKSFQCKFQFTMTSHDFPNSCSPVLAWWLVRKSLSLRSTNTLSEQNLTKIQLKRLKDDVLDEGHTRCCFVDKAMYINVFHWWCLVRTCLVLLGNNLPLLVRGPELQHDHIEVHVGPTIWVFPRIGVPPNHQFK